MATPEALHYQERQQRDYTPASAVEAGDIIHLVDGIAGVVVTDLAASQKGAIYTAGKSKVLTASATVFAAGDAVYWDVSASLAITAPGAVGDHYLGTAVVACANGDTRVLVDLNAERQPSIVPVFVHTVAATLTKEQSGTLHINTGASGGIALTLPQDAQAGCWFEFALTADDAMQILPGSAGGIYIKGDKQADTKYISMTDIGDFCKLVADGNGDWIAVNSISGADADITVQS
jgi:predicted RecA/RadA family phage recombinase